MLTTNLEGPPPAWTRDLAAEPAVIVNRWTRAIANVIRNLPDSSDV